MVWGLGTKGEEEEEEEEEEQAQHAGRALGVFGSGSGLPAVRQPPCCFFGLSASVGDLPAAHCNGEDGLTRRPLVLGCGLWHASWYLSLAALLTPPSARGMPHARGSLCGVWHVHPRALSAPGKGVLEYLLGLQVHLWVCSMCPCLPESALVTARHVLLPA